MRPTLRVPRIVRCAAQSTAVLSTATVVAIIAAFAVIPVTSGAPALAAANSAARNDAAMAVRASDISGSTSKPASGKRTRRVDNEHIRLTTALITGSSPLCDEYKPAACLGTDGAQVIISAVQLIITIWAILNKGSSPEKDQNQDQGEEGGGKTEYGKCLDAEVGTMAHLTYGACNTATGTWIIASHGDGISLESQYWLDQGDAVYITGDPSSGDVYLQPYVVDSGQSWRYVNLG